MKLRPSHVTHSAPTRCARIVVVLACLLASSFLPATAVETRAALPVEVPTPWEDGGQESESVKSATVRTVLPAHRHVAIPAPAFHRDHSRASESIAVRYRPPGGPARLFILRC